MGIEFWIFVAFSIAFTALVTMAVVGPSLSKR